MTAIRTSLRIALALAMLLPLAACIRITVKGDPAAAMDTLEELPALPGGAELLARYRVPATVTDPLAENMLLLQTEKMK